MSFCPLAEMHSLTGYEPKDLTEESNSILVKPMFFHKPSMTSACDTSESTATPPPESDLVGEKQVPTDHSFITPSEKTQCQVHLTSEKVQGNLSRCSHTEESLVKTHFPTEKAFPQDINQFKEKMKLASGSLIWKKLLPSLPHRNQFFKNILWKGTPLILQHNHDKLMRDLLRRQK